MLPAKKPNAQVYPGAQRQLGFVNVGSPGTDLGTNTGAQAAVAA